MSNIWKVIIHSCSKPPTSFLSSLHSTSSPSGPSRRGAQPSVTWWPTKWCTFGWTNQPAEPLAEPPMKHWLSEKLQEILDKPLQSKIDMKQENTRFKQQTTLQLEKWLDMVLEVAVVPTKIERLDQTKARFEQQPSGLKSFNLNEQQTHGHSTNKDNIVSLSQATGTPKK